MLKKKTPSLKLSLSGKKRSPSPGGLSLLKRRKLPLSGKRKLPTSKSPLSMFKHKPKDDEKSEDHNNEPIVRATILPTNHDLDDDEPAVPAVPLPTISVHDEGLIEPKAKDKSTPSRGTSPSPPKTKKFKPSMARPTLATPSIVSEKRILLHAGPAESLPPGWTIKHYKRTTGLKHTDRYWFSPLLKKKFRSLAQVGRFLDFLEKVEGDEARAWEMFRTSPPGPDEIRSRNRIVGNDGGKEKKKKLKNDYGILGTSLSSNVGATLADSYGYGHNFGSESLNSGKKGGGGAMARSWKLPQLNSPGLYVVPPPSLLHRHRKEQQKKNGTELEKGDEQEERKALDCDLGPKIDLNEQRHITPSLLFDHALFAAGYSKEKLKTSKYIGSSVTRCVDDMFNTDIAVDGIELVPKELWSRTSTVSPSESHLNGGSLVSDNIGNGRRLTKESLLEGLRHLVEENPLSSHCYQFEDMIPTSLTKSLPRCYMDEKNEYVQKVKEREDILCSYYKQKEANEDLLDAYENKMDEWRKRKEQVERRIAKKAAKEAATLKRKEENEANLNGDENRNAPEDTNMKKQDGLKECMKKVTKGDEKESHAIKETKNIEGTNKEDADGPGPEPVPPILPTLIEVPPVPIPPLLGSIMEDSEATCILKDKEHLVSHIDPKSFYPNGRYYEFFSNGIADPQFVGPNAPGVVGLSNISGTGLATSYSSERLSGTNGGTASSSEMGKSNNSSVTNGSKGASSSSKGSLKSLTNKPKKVAIGPTPTNTSVQLKKIMEKGGQIAKDMRDSIIKSAVYASRTGVHSGSFVGSTGETYPDISKAFSNHAKCRPCVRCKNNKQGAYHCRLKRRHTDKDCDGGRSHIVLAPLFDAPLEDLVVKTKPVKT